MVNHKKKKAEKYRRRLEIKERKICQQKENELREKEQHKKWWEERKKKIELKKSRDESIEKEKHRLKEYKNHQTKKKIAICLSGFIGNPFFNSVTGLKNLLDINKNIALLKCQLELSYYHIAKYIIEYNPKYEFDIFIHSWDNEIKQHIIDTFKPKKYIIENVILNFPLKLPIKDKHQILSKLLSVNKVTELLNDYILETKTTYEQVILTRFDCVFLPGFEIKDKYINNYIKIIKKSPKHLNGIVDDNFYNNRLWKNLKMTAIEHIIMSNFDNIYNYAQSYHKLIRLINTGKLTRFDSCHHLYMKLLLDALPKRNYNFIIDKNEIYSGIMRMDIAYETNISRRTYLEDISSKVFHNLIRIVYFYNNPYNILKISIGGDYYKKFKDKYKLIDIEQLFKKYNLPADINDIVSHELNIKGEKI